MANPADQRLLTAAAEGDLRGVTGALEAGADPGARSASGETALQLAAHSGNLDVVQFFLDRGGRITPELLAGVRAKVDSLRKNAESGMVDFEAVEAWKAFAAGMLTLGVRQDLPQLVKDLAAASIDERYVAMERAAACVSSLNTLVSDENPEVRAMAQHALKMGAGVRKR